MQLQLSTEEIRDRQLKPETLDLAAQAVRVDGCAVFERALPESLITQLREGFQRVFEEHVKQTDPNRGANRYQMHLPFAPPFADPQVYENPLVLSVLDELLGKDCICHYFASDTPMPGSDYQAVHSDITLLFPEMPLSLPAYSIVVNIPLVDFTEENGPVEIWPGGTHLFPGGTKIADLAPKMRSEKVIMPAGSLLIRDMRMWHRGTPNRSDHIRPNMALIYSRPWLNLRYPKIQIGAEKYAGLSERAKSLFRLEDIG